MSQLARCSFYVREVVTVEPTTYRYRQTGPRGPGGGLGFSTEHPPAVGDLIFVADEDRGGASYRVISRLWRHSSYGSMDWPYSEPASKMGPLVYIIVEPAAGPFVDEAEEPEDDE